MMISDSWRLSFHGILCVSFDVSASNVWVPALDGVKNVV